MTVHLDLFRPRLIQAPLPVILWLHGGGWVSGSKDKCPAARLVSRGYAVASVEYRLSGHALFPAQIEDCKAAVRWLRAHAPRYELDPARIGVIGSSSGGHLAAMLGTTGDRWEFDIGEHINFDSRVQAVCDLFGPTDFLQMDAHAADQHTMRHDAADSYESRLVGGPIQDHPDRVARANPIAYVNNNVPPFLIMHGDQDDMVPIHQSELLFHALSRCGGAVTFHRVVGAGHGFRGLDVWPTVGSFFDQHLKATPF